MAVQKGDFSQGNVSRNILRLGLPMMLAELVHVLYNIVDRMYIGHMPEGGTAALTGLGGLLPADHHERRVRKPVQHRRRDAGNNRPG